MNTGERRATSTPTITFQRVPEAKTTKNRLHLDIWSDAIEDELGRFQIRRDPEGNEFCLVA